MIGSDAAIQLGGVGQTMEDWGAKMMTTTTSVWIDKRSLEERFAALLQAVGIT